MRRREFARAALAAPVLALGGCRLPLSLEQGLMGDCGKAHDMLRNPWVAAAWQGLRPERRYEGRLFGDLSAVTQANRAAYLPRLLGMEAWDGRLLNGSDYPLPGIIPIFSLDALVADGVLEERLVRPLRELRHVNALLFDFVLKRNLRFGRRRFPDSAFETRGFFS